MMRVLILLAAAGLVSCSPVSRRTLSKYIGDTETRFQDHTGFMLYDMTKDKVVFEHNSAKYFTPASNTKIFTFYTALSLLGDSIPAFRYAERNDSLILWGTGDPSLLNRNVFHTTRVLDFLRTTNKTLYLSTANFQSTHFGSGWAWDDYNDAYSAERSAFPIYGNTIHVQGNGNSIRATPSYFQQFVTYATEADRRHVVRSLDNNILTVYQPVNQRLDEDIPARISADVIVRLLADTLGRPVNLVSYPPDQTAKPFYSEPADSLYKVMMQESDNFIAEQLLLLSAGAVSDTLKPEIAIDYMKKHLLADLPDAPVWVDGSGLSRYNLFTPRSIVALWKKIYAAVPQERLFQLLAIGGRAGTIRNYYKAPQPYIFGKTGSLSNNHCLSGYLVTRSGKTLIFSFMNSNFTVPSSEIRKNMQHILNLIYEKY